MAIASADLTSNAFRIYMISSQRITPFSIIPLFGWIFNLAYFYLLASFILYGKDNPKERRKVWIIGASIFLFFTLIGSSYFFWAIWILS